MTIETSLIDSALRNWRSNIDRTDKLFGNLSQEQLLQEVAAGKSRLIYLWGHRTAFNDALIPLLGFGSRILPELDLMLVSKPDRTVFADGILRQLSLPADAEISQEAIAARA